MTILATCSPVPHAAVQKGPKGNQWWRREVYHLTSDKAKTLCGRACHEWSSFQMTEIDRHCCKICERRSPSPSMGEG